MKEFLILAIIARIAIGKYLIMSRLEKFILLNVPHLLYRENWINHMPLSTEERGILDKQIDDAIRNADRVVERFRRIKNMFHFKEENDAAFGFILGVITGTFDQWMLDHSKEANQDTIIEIQKVILNRSAEIRNAIFKVG